MAFPTKDSDSTGRIFPERRFIFAGAALVAIVLAAFSPVLSAELLRWDDDVNIFLNPHIQKLNWESLRWMWADFSYLPRYRPLTWMSWAVLYHFFGADGRPFHLVALLLHAANAVLIFYLACRVLNQAKRFAGGSFLMPACWLGTLLWAVNPLRAEVVGWANCQMYTQSLFFLLLSLWAYLAAVEKPRPMSTPNYWVSVFFFTSALLTYPTGLGFVAVLLVVDGLLLRRLDSNPMKWLGSEHRRVLLEKIPFVLVTVALMGVALWARLNVTEHYAIAPSQPGLGWEVRAAQAFYIWAYYLWKPWVPFDLSPVYTTFASVNPVQPRFLGSAVAILFVTGFLLWKLRRWPDVLALWLCHLALLVPMLGLFEQSHYPSDRYSYIVGVLWSFAIAGLLMKIVQPQMRCVGIMLCVFFIVIWSIAAYRQSLVWHDTVSLFEATVRRLSHSPYRAEIYGRLGAIHLGEGRYVEAAESYEKCLEVIPEWAEVHAKLGETYFKLNQVEKGKAHYLRAIRNAPGNASYRNDFAVYLAMREEFGLALEQLNEAQRLNPQSPNACQNLGRVLQKLGRTHEAESYFKRAEQLRQQQKQRPD